MDNNLAVPTPGIRAAVTGSTGFIGRHLCAHLTRRGWRVRAILRPDSSSPAPEQTEHVVTCLDRSSLTEHLADCDVVFHLAGLTRAQTLKGFEAANVVAAREVALASKLAGARLIHVSSLAAGGTGTRSTPRTESDTPAPISPYGRSKLEGERAVRSIEHLDWTVIRPPAVYGPGDKDFLTLVQMASRGFFPQIGHPSSAFSFIYVKDLVRALDSVARATNTIGEIYYACDERPYSTSEVSSLLAKVVGRHYRPVRIPTSLLWLTMAFGFPLNLVGVKPLITPSRYREITSEGFVCSPEKLRKTTGFSAKIGLEDGLRRTFDWYTATHAAA